MASELTNNLCPNEVRRNIDPFASFSVVPLFQLNIPEISSPPLPSQEVFPFGSLPINLPN